MTEARTTDPKEQQPEPKDRTCCRCLQPRCDQFTMVCQRCQDAEAYALAEKRMKELRDGY